MRRRSNVTSTIEQYARQHRSALNGPEQALWSEIRGGRLGVWFRRQVVIGRFIVDFLAPRAASDRGSRWRLPRHPRGR